MKNVPTFKNKNGKFIHGRELIEILTHAVYSGEKFAEYAGIKLEITEDVDFYLVKEVHDEKV